MKTTTYALRSLSKMTSPFLAVGLLASFTPNATAAATADGSYEITKISASFENNGDPVTVPNYLLKNALSRKGTIVIRDNQFPVLKRKWYDVLNNFNFFNIEGTLEVTGPSSLTLTPTTTGFGGTTDSPVLLKFTGDLIGLEFKMDLRTTYTATVVGSKLTITAPVRIRTAGNVTATGTVKVVAEKL